MRRLRLGVDIGGTFTDFALLDEASGALTVLKRPSTPERPSASVFTGVETLARTIANAVCSSNSSAKAMRRFASGKSASFSGL